jgi:hypothetical protein
MRLMQSLRCLLKALPHHTTYKDKTKEKEEGMSSSNNRTQRGKEQYSPPEPAGRFVLLSFNSMYASISGLYRHSTTGSIAILFARVSGRMYPVVILTDCCHRSCSNTMKPESSCEALPRMASQPVRTCQVAAVEWRSKSA